MCCPLTMTLLWRQIFSRFLEAHRLFTQKSSKVNHLGTLSKQRCCFHRSLSVAPCVNTAPTKRPSVVPPRVGRFETQPSQSSRALGRQCPTDLPAVPALTNKDSTIYILNIVMYYCSAGYIIMNPVLWNNILS